MHVWSGKCLRSYTLADLKSSPGVIEYARHLLPSLVFIAGLSGMGGLSFLLSALSDMLAIASLNLYVGYLVMDKIYVIQLSALYSLWNLFRGLRG